MLMQHHGLALLKAIRTPAIIGQYHPPCYQRSWLMASNRDLIVQHIQQDFQALLAYVSGPQAQTQNAYTVELTLFRRLLALGAALLRLFFLTCAAERPAAPLVAPHDTALPYHDQRSVAYFSVFGKLSLTRHYFYAAGLGGQCPLD